MATALSRPNRHCPSVRAASGARGRPAHRLPGAPGPLGPDIRYCCLRRRQVPSPPCPCPDRNGQSLQSLQQPKHFKHSHRSKSQKKCGYYFDLPKHIHISDLKSHSVFPGVLCLIGINGSVRLCRTVPQLAAGGVPPQPGPHPSPRDGPHQVCGSFGAQEKGQEEASQ